MGKQREGASINENEKRHNYTRRIKVRGNRKHKGKSKTMEGVTGISGAIIGGRYKCKKRKGKKKAGKRGNLTAQNREKKKTTQTPENERTRKKV